MSALLYTIAISYVSRTIDPIVGQTSFPSTSTSTSTSIERSIPNSSAFQTTQSDELNVRGGQFVPDSLEKLNIGLIALLTLCGRDNMVEISKMSMLSLPLNMMSRDTSAICLGAASLVQFLVNTNTCRANTNPLTNKLGDNHALHAQNNQEPQPVIPNTPRLERYPDKPNPSVKKLLSEIEDKPLCANDLFPLMDQNYEEYVKQKSTNVDLPERFQIKDYTIEELVDRATNPLTDKVDSQSLDEAVSTYQAEYEKIMIEPSRPTKAEAQAVNLDFNVKGMKDTLPDGRPYKKCDIKAQVSSPTLILTNRTLEGASFKMGEDLVAQKHRFVGQGDLESAELVAHLIDLHYVAQHENQIVIQNTLEGARSKGGGQGIFFMNDK